MTDHPGITLGALKDLLHRFTLERRDWPHESATQEFGALVLCLLQQADRLGVDLVSAGEAHLRHAATRQLTAVATPGQAR